MRDSYILAKKELGPTFTLGVHPTPGGHLLITCELLKVLTCDGDIGRIDVDMKGGAHASAGHSVVSFSGGAVVLDSSKYPFCYHYDRTADRDVNGLAAMAPYVPFSQDLNRLILKVTNLDAPSASVTWGNETKLFTSAQLAQGVNLAEQFAHTPFDATFARVMQAVGEKQEFENYMIKGTSNYFGNDNGGNFDENMIAVQAQMDAAVKALLTPVRHTIAIVPTGASEAAAPVITGTMMAYATVGQAFSYKVSALHAPTAFAAAGLPKGLTINAETGEITGTLTEPAVSAIALTATNASGTGAGTLNLTVTTPRPERPWVTSPDTASATVGVAFTYQIVATNAPTHYFASSPGDKGTFPPASSLPAGLTYDTATGLVSGTPKVAGTYTVRVAAMNDSGVSPKDVTLTVKDK
jgi:hypothetical protein